MNRLYEDRDWTRAAAWLTPADTASPSPLRVLGVPVTRGSITPSRCDLAPQAIRRSLLRLSTFDILHQRDVLRLPAADLGDLPLAEASPEEACRPISRAVREALEGAEALVLLGGDNALTYPACAALESSLADCGLVTFDAHLDLRHLENGLLNGNPVRALLREGLPGQNIVQIGIQSFANSQPYFQVAMDAGITVVPVEQVAEEGIAAVTHRALASLAGRVRSIYVDLDLDVQDRAFAPACAGSRPGGLTPLDVRQAAYLCGLHPKVRVLDLVELDPERDSNDATAVSAAACLLSFASGVLGRREAAAYDRAWGNARREGAHG